LCPWRRWDQPHIAAPILDQGGDDLVALKSHRQKAFTAVTEHVQHPIEPNLPWRPAENFWDAVDDSHGRLVRSKVWAMTELAPLPALAKWPGRPSVIAVETMRTAHQHAPVTRDDRFYLSRLARSAAAFATMMRQQWQMEHT
jgi:hypothetical protein